jgi:hypothetical protein
MNQARLPNFEDAILRADARWFLDSGFINEDTYRRVLAWLEGTEDSEAQQIATSWMELDAQWVKRFEPAGMAFFWYVAPVVKLESYLIRKTLRRQIKRLEAGEAGKE